jgi:hypothetical protein
MTANPTSNHADCASLEKRISLPKPDAQNITVLTRELPNDPILPWHHYDSPWLDAEEVDETADDDTEVLSADSVENSVENEVSSLESDDAAILDETLEAIAPISSESEEEPSD